jgi:hypothetical protein
MAEHDGDLWFQSFNYESIPLAENTPAEPRPAHRPRDGASAPTICDGIFQSFDCVTEQLPPGTLASPRPPDRPRITDATPVPTDADDAFAREVASRVLEYVNSRSGGLSAEQLATLVQQFISRRSA